MRRTGLTLMELLIAVTLIGSIILLVSSGSIFLYRQFYSNVSRYDIHAQINFVLEHIKLYCLSAVSVDSGSLFTAGVDDTKNEFCFTGQGDPYTITPDDTSDDVQYCYRIAADSSLKFYRNGVDAGTLMDARYEPVIEFIRSATAAPNSLTVKLTGKLNTPATNISKSERLRFWFVDIVE